MLKRILLTTCLLNLALFADGEVYEEDEELQAAASLLPSFEDIAYAEPTTPVESPEQIQFEINQAQRDFEIAEKMFVPWYTGPLITGSASNVPPGNVMMQPYLFLTTNYAQFNDHRKSINTPNTFIVNPLVLVETGLTDWMDISIIPQGVFRWRQHAFGDGFGDLPVQLGFQLTKETPYIPKMRLIVGEIFPTGKYERLNPRRAGLDSTGAGVYATLIGLNVSKVFWWMPLHTVAVRMSTNYSIPNFKAHVHNLNSYGGGIDTNGKVAVGGTFNGDLGIEVSISQRWVFATDIAYTYSGQSTFRGDPGTLDGIIPAPNGAPSSDQLSLAPAIEYNRNENSGFIGGVWFTVTGRNSANFASVVLSYCQIF